MRTLKLARELLDGHALVKLEVLGDANTLFPNVRETLKAAERLIADGFQVMVYTSDDPIVARAWNDREEIHQMDRPERCLILPRLLRNRDPRRGELVLDVLPRILDRRRPGRTGPERHEPAQMFPRPVGVELRNPWRLHHQRQHEPGPHHDGIHRRCSRGT